MRTSKRFVVAGVIALATLLPGTAAGAAPVRQPLRVSQGDPFAACTVGGTPTSVLYPGAEVEPSVATDRFRPSRVVGVWQQDRWTDGGAHGLVAGFSTDGGRSFQEVPWPASQCAPGGLNYERSSDPWVSIGPDGTVYGSALPFDANTPRNAVAAITSRNGGRTWTATPLIEDTQANFFNDKNSVTADPVRVGSAYQVWDRLEFSPDGTLFVNG